jgi:iron complex outermembrane receptor protein
VTTWSIGDDITVNEHWSLLAGVGHSTIDDAEITMIFPSGGYKKSKTSPTFSLIYAPSETITTYASYIEALERGGQAAEQFNGIDVTNAGEIFSPLISEQIELGAKITLGGILLSTAIFQIDKGLQYYDISSPQLATYVQDGRQVHKGIEVSAFGKATENLSVIGGFTLLDAEITEQKQIPALEGKRPPTVSDTFAKLHLEYQLPIFSAITLSGGINYNSDQFGDNLNTDTLPAYTLVDIGARYMIDVGNNILTLRLDINNLNDELYWANAGYLSDPRALLMSASVEF